jgi:hypothetical protein
MTEQEAISTANAYVLQTYGVQAEPLVVRRIKSHQTYWTIMYGPSVLFPKEVATGSTVDGGELILHLDEASGTISIFA